MAVRPPPAEPAEENLGLERLIFFSDAVFAIAITLLVLDIRPPDRAASFDPAQWPALLAPMMPQIFSYVLSFFVVGSYWVAHHRTFQYIGRYDYRFLWLNLAFLFFIAFIPVPTTLMAQYGDQPFAIIFYDGVQILTALLKLGLWLYAAGGRRLIAPAVPAAVIRYNTYRSAIAPVVFLLSIGIALTLGPVLAVVGLLLLAFAGPLALRLHARHPERGG
jgi:TMEM175 potassium channel family protein